MQGGGGRELKIRVAKGGLNSRYVSQGGREHKIRVAKGGGRELKIRDAGGGREYKIRVAKGGGGGACTQDMCRKGGGMNSRNVSQMRA